MSERVSFTTPGPKFTWGEGRSIEFSFINDPRSVIGPRPATAADKANHPGAWAEFVREAEPAATPPAEAAPAATVDALDDDALRALITDRTGVPPHHRVGRPRLLAQARELQ